jgi:hypothetical protein
MWKESTLHRGSCGKLRFRIALEVSKIPNRDMTWGRDVWKVMRRGTTFQAHLLVRTLLCFHLSIDVDKTSTLVVLRGLKKLEILKEEAWFSSFLKSSFASPSKCIKIE